jgi:hypothetical protein
MKKRFTAEVLARWSRRFAHMCDSDHMQKQLDRLPNLEKMRFQLALAIYGG